MTSQVHHERCAMARDLPPEEQAHYGPCKRIIHFDKWPLNGKCERTCLMKSWHDENGPTSAHRCFSSRLF